jgi:hypothetical protein
MTTPIALLDVASYVDGHDFTGDSNSTLLTLGRVPLDRTNFRSGAWTTLRGGLRSAEFAQKGFWAADTDSVDSAAFADLAATDRVHTMAPTEQLGGVAYLWQAQRFQYNALEGDIGQLAGFTLNSQGASDVGVVRGKLAVVPFNQSTLAAVTYNATGVAGAAVELAAVGADQSLYAAVHVLGTPGTTVTLQLQSDVDDTFASATTQATVGPLTAAGGTWVTPIAGAITDTWWRVNISAITGTFTLAVALGVQ